MERVRVSWAWVLLVGSAVVDSGCGRAAAQGARPPVAAVVPVELTVYKDDFAMIRQRREVELESGSTRLRVEDVSRQLDPNSVIFDQEAGRQVVSSTFDMGVGTNGNALQRLAGRPVELILPSTDGKLGERIAGTLEPTADGGFLLRTPDRVYLNPPGTISAKDEDGAPTLPGLSIEIQSDRAGRAPLGMSYLTRGLSWSADYVARLDPERARMRIEAWATVTNTTGVPYREAKLTFVAGSPNRAVRQRAVAAEPVGAPGGAAYAKGGYAGDFENARPVGELYEYKVDAPASIGIDQMNRVRMLQAEEVPVRLDYSVALPALGGWDPGASRVGAQLAVHFTNRKADGLGMPLPAGAVRVYDGGEGAQYVGASSLADLPEDSGASLTLSKVFDVYAEPRVVKTRRIDKRTIERTLRIRAHNAKSREIELRIVQPIASPVWKVMSGPGPERLNGSTAQWKLTVPAGSEREMTATVRMQG
jgi:hypothetical protein